MKPENSSPPKKFETAESKLQTLSVLLPIVTLASLARNFNNFAKVAIDEKKDPIDRTRAAAISVQLLRYALLNFSGLLEENESLKPLAKGFKTAAKTIEPLSDAAKIAAAVIKISKISKKEKLGIDDAILVLALSKDIFKTTNKLLKKAELPTIDQAADKVGGIVKYAAGKVVDLGMLSKTYDAMNECYGALSIVGNSLRNPSTRGVFNIAADLGQLRIASNDVKAEFSEIIERPFAAPVKATASSLQEMARNFLGYSQ